MTVCTPSTVTLLNLHLSIQEHWGTKDSVRDSISVMLPASHVEAPSPDVVSGAFGR